MADPGHLCVYEDSNANAGDREFLGDTSRYGARLVLWASGDLGGYSTGTWAVTAP